MSTDIAAQFLKRLPLVVALTSSWSASLLHAAESKSDEPSVLPLPKAAAGSDASVINPILSAPPEGLPPLPLDFKIDAAPLDDLPPNALKTWRIARMPARENRDAMAAYWTRVQRSKTRWRVRRDTKTGMTIAEEGSASGQSQTFKDRSGAPEFDLKIPSKEGPMRELQVQWMIPVNSGWIVSDPECVVWFAKSGARLEVISQKNLTDGVEIQGRYFALDKAQGSILELIQKGEQWTAEPFYKPKTKQRLCAMTTLPDGRFCLVQSHRLIALSLDGSEEILLSNPGWAIYDPFSVIFDEELKRVFVGMRHFVARCAIEPGNRASVLLRPSDG